MVSLDVPVQALSQPWLSALAGMASALVFVYVSGWCLARLTALGAPVAFHTLPDHGHADVVLDFDTDHDAVTPLLAPRKALATTRRAAPRSSPSRATSSTRPRRCWKAATATARATGSKAATCT